MKLFGWMQSKVMNGKQPKIVASSSNNRIQAPCKEEFSDWPQALFAIGTFGNSNLKEDSENSNNPHEGISQLASCQDQPQEGIGPEEIKELQKELNLLLEKPFTSEELEENTVGEEDSQNNDMTFHRISGSSMVFSRGKDIFLDNTNNAIGKRSLSFLVKKMFICSSGFSHVPDSRDSFPEAKLEKSRIEKLLRAILHKKIYPQSSAPKVMPKKYLGRKNMSLSDCDSDDEVNENGNDGSKWVKTDSEYIVLEI